MRLAPRFAAAITVLVLTAAGCGGSTVAYREVPGEPVQLEVPGNGTGITGGATPTPTPEADAEATPEADADAASATEEGGTGETAAPETGTGDGTAGGGTEAPTGQEPDDTAPAQETPDPGLEDYCAANPGAC